MAMTLTVETEKLVERRLVKSGFSSADELIRAALESLDEQNRVATLETKQLELLYPGFREKIAAGLAEADAGVVTDGETFFDELERDGWATEQ